MGTWKRACLTAVTAVGCMAATLQPAPVAAVMATTVSAHLSPAAAIPLGNATSITGRVTQGGSPVADTTVQLKTDRFPFGSYKDGPQQQSGTDGRYSFTVTPSLDTRYRVTALGASSTPLRAVVVMRQGAWGYRAPSNVVKVHVKVHYPPSVPEAGRNVYWYLALNGSRTERYKTTTTIPKPFKPGWSRISARLRTGLPAGTPYRFNFHYLIRDLPRHGLGLRQCRSTLKGDRFPLGHASCRRPARFRIPAWS